MLSALIWRLFGFVVEHKSRGDVQKIYKMDICRKFFEEAITLFILIHIVKSPENKVRKASQMDQRRLHYG